MTHSFYLFGWEHFFMILVILMMALFPTLLLARSASRQGKRRFELSLGWLMVAWGIVKHVYGPLWLGEPWQIWLPLHMCQVANFLIAYALISGKRGLINDVIYFWTFAGASMALITPDLKYGWPDPNFIMYVITHGLLILGALYFTLVEGVRPTSRSVWKAFKVSVGYMLVIFPLNYLIGVEANYLYLRYRPVVGSLMDFLPQPPGHIPFIMLLAYIIYWLVYLPYALKDSLTGRLRR